MSIGHDDTPRPFKPTEKGGGSKKGKKQGKWPWILKIVAHAVIINWKGTMEAYLSNRKGFPRKILKERMDSLCPGWLEWYRSEFGERIAKTKNSCAYTDLLDNRVYKMYYDGTSSRGVGHDPNTRAAFSVEHYTKHIPQTHRLAVLHDDIRRGSVVRIDNWMDYLPDDAELKQQKRKT